MIDVEGMKTTVIVISNYKSLRQNFHKRSNVVSFCIRKNGTYGYSRIHSTNTVVSLGLENSGNATFAEINQHNLHTGVDKI